MMSTAARECDQTCSSVTGATRRNRQQLIRSGWTDSEKERRRQLANLQQQRLLSLILCSPSSAGCRV